MECLHEKTGISFKQIYKLTKRFLKRLNIKKRKISKEIDQESTKMNL
jgi:protein involved in ribonucleotide reduction